MIYIDPTEMRGNSKLSPRVIKASQPLIGLETATGADLLISSFDRLSQTVLHPPGSLLLKRAVKTGMLVQRKSDHDLFRSIKEPGLAHILARMLQHEGAYAWLMIVGDFQRNPQNNKVILNGREEEWHWNSFRGAKDMWQIRNGEVSEFKTEEEAADWLLYWNDHISKLDEEKIVRPKHDRGHLKFDARPWRGVLEEFPGVGPSYSSALADYCGTLADSLCWMSEPASFGLNIGVGMKNTFREFYGLKENETLVKLDEDDPVMKEIIRACAVKGVENAQEITRVHSGELPVQKRALSDPIVGG